MKEFLNVEEKAARINTILGTRRVSVMSDSGLNRMAVNGARVLNGSLQVRSGETWHFIGEKVPVFAGTDTRIW